MKAWLLVAVQDDERVYGGNIGYDDEPTRIYRFDNNVPNSTQIAARDLVVIRNKTDVLGSALVVNVRQSAGTKEQRRCPTCGKSKIKARKQLAPRYLCECGATFDDPVVEHVPCTLYEADFGDTYSPVGAHVPIARFWETSPNLNKQFSILELDPLGTLALLKRSLDESWKPDEAFPIGTNGKRLEGGLRRVYVNRYERDDVARNLCLAHYGHRCSCCGMDFQARYGPLATGVIHVHHVVPLSDVSGEYEVDPIKDLRPVCPNCHVVIHLATPVFTVDHVKAMLASGAEATP